LREVAFDTMSVVMMASAAAPQLSGFRSASAAGSAAIDLLVRQRFQNHAG
jgi:hypothetical protein